MNKKPSLVLLSLGTAAAAAVLVSCKPAQPAAETPSASPKPAATAAATATPASAPATPPPASSPAASPAEAKTEILNLKDPVATVNGEPITKAQLDEVFNGAVQSAGAKAADLTAEQKLEGYRQLLDELIMDKLVSKAAEGEKVTQEQIDAEIKKIKSQFPSEEEFSKELSTAGQSVEKLNENLKKMLQQQHWLEGQIAGKTDVTEEDAKKFYDENQAEFQEPDTVKASHILFRVNKDDSEEVANKKLEEAKKAAARAKKGEDFTKLAKELSEEPGAKESGGDLGYFPKDRMVPEFAEVAFKEKPGDISEPVRTQFGWHVIKVTDKKSAHTVPFDEVKQQLIAYLKSDKQRQAVQQILKSLRDSAKIENTLPAPVAPALPTAPMSPTTPMPPGN